MELVLIVPIQHLKQTIRNKRYIVSPCFTEAYYINLANAAMTNPSDECLIEQIKAGNNSAFEPLVKKYQQKVFQISIGFLHNEDDAADLTQEVFIRVFKRLNSFKGNSSFATWLYRITVNMALNYQRKQSIKYLFKRIDGADETTINIASDEKSDKKMLRDEEKVKIDHILKKLTSSQRKAFVLSHYQELSNQEVADVMKISLKATESLLHRARTRLRVILTENYKNS